MFTAKLKSCIFAVALCLTSADGAGVHCNHKRGDVSQTEAGLGSQQLFQAAPPVPLVTVSTPDIGLIASNTSAVVEAHASVAEVTAETVDSKALIIARDKASAYSAYSGLNDRGIPYQILIVSASGANLPSLNDSATHGNYGFIVVLSEVSYNKGGTIGYQSALSAAQWQALYNYQVNFGVRMVRLDVSPSADTGTTNLGGCCTGENLVSISNASAFPGTGLRVGAGLSTTGLYHYRAKITNASIATEFAQFAAPSNKSEGTGISTAAVINKFGLREQSYVEHPNQTPMYGSDPVTNYRVVGADLEHHITLMKDVNKKLPTGSNWFIEVGHNGNGNVEQADSGQRATSTCAPGPIEYPDQIDTALEFAKPIGTGKNLWPANTTDYPAYQMGCLAKDALLTWWQKEANLNSFGHISHTFTHEDEDNSTYFDVYREIAWNRGWLDSVGISKAKIWSPSGIIPPAITGLHNGDALRAWSDQGIVHVVGDNTRSVLLNKDNEHWPLISTVAANGFAGIQITPRWASNIYYNCDLADCTVAEWAATAKGVGDIFTLLNLERDTNVRHLLALRHDPYMFHQANLRYVGADDYTINGVDTTMSLFELWITYVTTEYIRLVTWPIITIKHDDIAASFRDRMARDQCKPTMSYTLDPTSRKITTVTVSTNSNTCAAPIPVTLPGPVVDQKGATAEQIGTDPLTLWVTLSGSPVTFTLATPFAI